MAKGTAVCTCKTCGETFKVTTTQFNRRQADEWVKYAEENFDECSDCYKKRMREKRQKELERQGLILRAEINNGVTKQVKLRFDGNTYPNKEKIKAIGGYRWSAREWSKKITLAELEGEIEKAKEIGAKIVLSKQTKFEKFVFDNKEKINSIKPEFLGVFGYDDVLFGWTPGEGEVIRLANGFEFNEEQKEAIRHWFVEISRLCKESEESKDD